ncbi:hypothetical protein TrRE_jg5402 [Triparma retinervis]|uniref:Uncharacterized protein n=1 Tax=Triparma retinervis TaxID=2557542 RepID=A0A9W7AAS1_9STRA|nr:hypothetical protein TrRE_jg5402 [Triparma retinervis]
MESRNASDKPGRGEKGHSNRGPAIHSAHLVGSCFFHNTSPTTCARYVNNGYCKPEELCKVTLLLIPVDADVKRRDYLIGCCGSKDIPSYHAISQPTNIDSGEIRAINLEWSMTLR